MSEESDNRDQRQCVIGIGNIGGTPADDEIQMDSGMCQAGAVGVFEVENLHPDGSNHLKPLCEAHRELLDNGPGMIVGEVDIPGDES